MLQSQIRIVQSVGSCYALPSRRRTFLPLAHSGWSHIRCVRLSDGSRKRIRNEQRTSSPTPIGPLSINTKLIFFFHALICFNYYFSSGSWKYIARMWAAVHVNEGGSGEFVLGYFACAHLARECDRITGACADVLTGIES